MRQINFPRNVDQPENTTMFFIAKEASEKHQGCDQVCYLFILQT